MSYDILSTNRAKPWHHVGHRILRPFSDPTGHSWCPRCQDWDTSQKEGRFEGSVYALKEWCRRCGTVITYAVFDPQDQRELARRARVWASHREPIKGE